MQNILCLSTIIYLYIYIYIYMCSVHIYNKTQLIILVFISFAYKPIRKFPSTNICIHICTCICICECICLCKCKSVCVYTCMYVYLPFIFVIKTQLSHFFNVFCCIQANTQLSIHHPFLGFAIWFT